MTQPTKPIEPPKAEMKPREDWTDLEYLEYSLGVLNRIYQDSVAKVKQTNNMIHELELDKKACKTPPMIQGADNILTNLQKEKEYLNTSIKNVRFDLKHYVSLLKRLKRGKKE